MKVACWAMGKTAIPYIREGIDDFTARISRYIPFEYHELKVSKARSANGHREKERAQVEKLLQQEDFLVLLDERGEQFTSPAFSAFLQQLYNTQQGRLVFLIGGPYGFDPATTRRANRKLALSAMTFPHDLVRLVFLEQLYRGMTIIRNEPYHH